MRDPVTSCRAAAPRGLRLHRFRARGGLLLGLVLLAPALTGCNQLEARVEIKKGIAAYKDEHYREALTQFQKGLALDPSLVDVWRSVGFAATALYKPGDESPANLEMAKVASDAFEKYLAAHPNDSKVSEYLTTTLINAGRNREAMDRLKKDALDPTKRESADRAIVGLLIKDGKWEDAYTWLRRPGGRDAVPLLSIGVNCWSKAYRDAMLDPVARGQVVDLGMRALADAEKLAPQMPEVLTYINLLYREKAKLEPDPLKAQDLYKLAEDYRARAMAIMQAAKK
jgi:tetratricopeptide (TPR) repeat protein